MAENKVAILQARVQAVAFCGPGIMKSEPNRFGQGVAQSMISSEQASQSALEPALYLLAELLERRLKRGVFTTEDAVRYTFFIALVQALSLQPEDIVLEHDHGAIARAKIDTWIPSFEGHAYGIEFKYDRPIPSGKNAPLTQKAGQIIKDMFRLAKIDTTLKAETVFVYLATREMAGYFSNPNNGLADLFGLQDRIKPAHRQPISRKSSRNASPRCG